MQKPTEKPLKYCEVFVYLPPLQGANQWFELQDLHVQELLPQMITLAEAYIQVLHGLHMPVLF